MPRPEFKVVVTGEESGGQLGSAVRFAHNSAMQAGVEILRTHARLHGGYWTRGEVLNAAYDKGPTVVRWQRHVSSPSQGEEFAALVTVTRPEEI